MLTRVDGGWKRWPDDGQSSSKYGQVVSKSVSGTATNWGLEHWISTPLNNVYIGMIQTVGVIVPPVPQTWHPIKLNTVPVLSSLSKSLESVNINSNIEHDNMWDYINIGTECKLRIKQKSGYCVDKKMGFNTKISNEEFISTKNLKEYMLSILTNILGYYDKYIKDISAQEEVNEVYIGVIDKYDQWVKLY